MLRKPQGARRYNDTVMLTASVISVDEYGHKTVSGPSDVLEVPAYVEPMSATRAMMTFEQADIVGLNIEFRTPGVEFNGLRWRGHEVHFAAPEDRANRGRLLQINGYYQVDNPKA